MFSACAYYTDILNQPIVKILSVNMGRIDLNWTVPNLNETIHTLKHYYIQIDRGSPILVRNTKTTVFIETFDVTNHTIQAYAVDNCDQEGDMFRDQFEAPHAQSLGQVAIDVSSPESSEGMPHISNYYVNHDD
jgi:hypothetical protein